jgi:hypothetical protein
MDENKIRRIVQDEIKKASKSSRFGFQDVPLHQHNGTDSPQIKEDNIVPNPAIVGTIAMAQSQEYTISLNSIFTPRNIMAYGVITGTYLGSVVRIMTTGSAQLTNGFYLQPGTSSSVITGTKQYPFPTKQPDGSTPSVPVQSSAYINVSRNTSAYVYAGVSEDHIVDVVYPNPSSISDIRARVTVIGYSKSEVKVSVPYLDSGWTVFLNYVIT